MVRVTLQQYSMGRSLTFQEEWAKAEANAIDLLLRVNSLFEVIGWDEPVTVSSGFRPSEINRKVSGAAKGSYHLIGRAIDILDTEGRLKHAFNPLMDKNASDLLRQLGLFMEHPDYCPTWVHFDTGNRVDRPTRVFRP